MIHTHIVSKLSWYPSMLLVNPCWTWPARSLRSKGLACPRREGHCLSLNPPAQKIGKCVCPRGIQWLGIRSGIVLGARRPAENDLRKRPCFVETAPSGWALSSLARPATVQKTRGWWDGPVDSSTSCSRPSGKLQLWQWNGTIPAPGAGTGRPSDPGQRLRKLAKGRRPGDVKSAAPAVPACHATR